jgi:dihydroneopterin aldolase
MDIVFLHNLRVDAIIGVWAWERRVRQTLTIDLDLGTDSTRAGASDDIADTVDYKAVSDRVHAFVSASEFNLLEALAGNVARIVLGEFAIDWVRVRITKQGVLRHTRDVGVLIERSRDV